MNEEPLPTTPGVASGQPDEPLADLSCNAAPGDDCEERAFEEERALLNITRLMRSKFTMRRQSKPRWGGMTIEEAMAGIEDELKELVEAVGDYIEAPTVETRRAVLYECGDVANQVAILADIVRQKSPVEVGGRPPTEAGVVHVISRPARRGTTRTRPPIILDDDC